MIIGDLYQPIGKLAAKFQFLEFVARALAIEFMKTDYDVGLCLVSEMSFSRLVAALSSIGKEKLQDPEILEQMDELANLLAVCEQERNRILHSAYGEMEEKLVRVKITAKQSKGLKKIFYEVNPKEIEEVTANIEQTREQLVKSARSLQSRGLISQGFF